MGYYAHGYGVVKTKEGTINQAFENMVWKLNDELCLDIDDVSLFRGEFHITVEENKYHDDDWKEFLNTINQFVEKGEFEFTGEGGESWKFKYYPEDAVWKEMMGEIVYNEETAKEI